MGIKPFKIILTTAVLLLFNTFVIAQKFISHAIKSGETLESIAKKYKVTPFNILSYNKEIKQGDTLRANTILAIPINATVSDKIQLGIEEKEPIGYRKHKVRRKETLFGIAKRYNISEEDIKRYNILLYTTQLKKGMRLKIPKYIKYIRIAPSESPINKAAYKIYTVKEKETRWSIAHAYGISIDSMIALNPTLSKTTDYLAVNQELKLPKLSVSTEVNKEVQTYNSYTVVPKGIGFYHIEKNYGVTAEELIKLNPEILERGGLKEGMLIRIPEKKIEYDLINTDNFIFYEVKPKENEFRLTRKLGLGYKELLELNPALRGGFKAGMILKLPKNREEYFEIKNTLIIGNKINLLDSINTTNRPRLVFMLPFGLDKLDLSDKENTLKTIEQKKDVKYIKYSLGFYSGALVALDSIKELGISVNVKTFDNQFNITKTKEILARENLKQSSAIIAPFDLLSLKEVAVYASVYGIPVISPFIRESDTSMGNVFFSVPTDAVLQRRILAYVKEKRTTETIITIADRKNDKAKKLIQEKFTDAKICEVLEEERNISINIDELAEMLSEEDENWVFLETDNFKLISSVISILNSFISENVNIKLWTTKKNKAFTYDIISNSHLSNLNFRYPSAYREVANSPFTERYKKRFAMAPDKYAVIGFDVTYDLLLKLAYKNNLFDVSNIVGEVEYTGHKFNYSKHFSSGYHNIASYIMMYKDMHIKQLK